MQSGSLPLPRECVGCLVAAALVLIAPCHLTAAESDDERLLNGLRQRRLFQLAEQFSQDRLNDDDLSDEQRTKLIIELIRTYAAHAINSPPQDRAALWESARIAAADFERGHADNTRLILVRVQDALTNLARGELLRQEAEIGAGAADALENAKSQIRAAATMLRELDQQLTKLIPLRTRRPEPGELSAAELASLQHNVQYQLARAFRNQGLCYPPGSDDRVASLSRALEQIAKPVTQLPAGDALLWRIYVDQAICLRLLGNLDKAAQALAALESTETPAAIQLEVRAEKARIAAARGRLDDALAIFDQGREIDRQTSARLDFALLEVYLAKWQAAGDSNDDSSAEKFQKLAVAVVDLLQQQHGAYWGRRGELLLVRSAARSGGARDLEILSRTADNLYLQKQYDEAIAAYNLAARQAGAAGDKRAAFELGYKAAAVVHVLKRHDEAARRMRALSLNLPTHPTASRVHWQGTLNASQHMAQQAKTDSAETAVVRYVDMLQEHLDKWPRSATADVAHFYLGHIEGYRQNWPQAIKSYLGVSPDYAGYEQAVASAAECSRHWFAELKEAGQPYDEQAARAVEYFERLVFDSDGQLPKTWDPVSRLAAATAARIRLQHTQNGHKSAANLLEAAIDASPDAPAQWKSTATALLVVALAGQPSRRSEAQARLSKLAGADPGELLAMLSGVSQSAQAARPAARKQMAALLLEAADLLADKQDRLDASGKLTLGVVRAEALAAAGKRTAGQKAYAELAKQYPDNAIVQRGYAEFLSAAEDMASLEKAVGQWRRVVLKTRPRTDAWYQAKYSVAHTLFRLGRKQESATFIRYLQATPPGITEDRWQASFQQLLARCGT